MSMSNPTDRVEIITSVQRRRRWTAAEKVRIVEETFEPGMTVRSTRRRGLHKLELGSACQPKIRRTGHVSIVKFWTGLLTLHASGRGISSISEAVTWEEEEDWGSRGRR